MSKLTNLILSMGIIGASAYPLIELIQTLGGIEHSVSIVTIGLILVWLVIALLIGAVWFYFTWIDITED